MKKQGFKQSAFVLLMLAALCCGACDAEPPRNTNNPFAGEPIRPAGCADPKCVRLKPAPSPKYQAQPTFETKEQEDK
jgi:hypothetical protein